LGISIYSAIEQKFEFKRGPVFANVLLADESTAPSKTQSALLEAMNEGQVTIDAHSYQLPQPFLVLATQNPIEHHGTYPCRVATRSLLDARSHGIPRRHAEREILRAEAGVAQLENLRPVLSAADVVEIQQAVAQVHVDESLITYLLNIVTKTRESEYLSLGVSPGLADALRAQAMAFLEGRDYCTPKISSRW